MRAYVLTWIKLKELDTNETNVTKQQIKYGSLFIEGRMYENQLRIVNMENEVIYP